jgi:hypothetical protein
MIRILRHGLPAAVILAVVGYLMAEVAGLWVAGNDPGRRAAIERTDLATQPTATPGPDVATALRARLPFTMAAWGFGLVVVFELLLAFWRGGAAPPAPTPPGPATDDEVEKLLNQLLQQAEAAEAARQSAATDTPPPAPAPTPFPAPSGTLQAE